MDEFYVSKERGSDSNPGTWEQPFFTLQKVVDSITSSGNRVHILDGVYFEHSLGVSATTFDNTWWFGYRNIVVNGTGAPEAIFICRAGASSKQYIVNCTLTGAPLFRADDNYSRSMTFIGCNLVSPWSEDMPITYRVGSGTMPRLFNTTCVGYALKTSSGGQIRWENRDFFPGSPETCGMNNIILAPSWSFRHPGHPRDYNASNVAVLHGTNGWDTGTFAPPFLDSDQENWDVRFDPEHAQYGKYTSEGFLGGLVGSGGRNWIGWNALVHPVDTGVNTSNHPAYLPSLMNDPSYFDTSFKEVEIDSSNNKLDFDEGDGEETATIASGTYTSAEALFTAVQTAVNDAASDTHTINMSESFHANWSTNGTELSLLTSTGTNSSSSAWSDLGFDTGSDLTGSTAYAGKQYLCVGSEEDDRTLVQFDSGNAYLDLNVNEDGTMGRFLSPVIDLRSSRKLEVVHLSKVVVGDGDVNTLEVRADSDPFDVDAASTTLPWTSVTEGGLGDLGPYRFWQIRGIIDQTEEE